MLLQEITPKRAGQFVDEQHVQSLIANYKKERWIHNSKRIGKADSLSVWYGLDELQEFLDTARKHGADGIKMNFGIYKKDTAGEPLFEDRQTIVLVATRSKINADGSTFNKSIYKSSQDGPKIIAFNIAKMCPPICSGGGGIFGNKGHDQDSLGITLLEDPEKGLLVL
jgi:hypothetical protein